MAEGHQGQARGAGERPGALPSSLGAPCPWEYVPPTRWATAEGILIYEQPNLPTPPLSGGGDVFFLERCRAGGCFEPRAFLSSQPLGV